MIDIKYLYNTHTAVQGIHTLKAKKKKRLLVSRNHKLWSSHCEQTSHFLFPKYTLK